MELIQGIETRRSIRGFKPDPVPAEILEKIVQTTLRSPSYMNTQPWEVAVVTGAKRDELSRILYEKAASDVKPNPDIPSPEVWPPELEKRFRDHAARRFQFLGIDRADEKQRKQQRLSNFEFYGAPCMIIVHIDNALTGWAIFDAGSFSQNLLLAAHSYGLGTCIQASVVSYADVIRDFLGLPRTRMLVVGIALGYPDPVANVNSYISTRAEMKDVVRWYK